MSGSMVTLEVNDPHEITPAMWQYFAPTPTASITPAQFRARTYQASDWRKYQVDKDAYHTTASVAKLGSICFTQMADREAIDMVIKTPGLELYCLSLVRSGAGAVTWRGLRDPIALSASGAVVFHANPNTIVSTDRQCLRMNVWLPASLLHNEAQLLLETSSARGLDLTAAINAADGPGATLCRMTCTLFDSLAQPDSAFAAGFGLAAAEELLLQLLVLAAAGGQRLPSAGATKPAAPVAVRRAEDFIRANADAPLTVARIAQAAGCSVRALQLAFRRFRHVSPMAVVRDVRLEQAYRLMAAADGPQTVTGIAARFHFENAGRFAAAYRRRFGRNPSEALRAGRRVSPFDADNV